MFVGFGLARETGGYCHLSWVFTLVQVQGQALIVGNVCWFWFGERDGGILSFELNIQKNRRQSQMILAVKGGMYIQIVKLAAMSLYQMFLCLIIFLLERLNLRLPYLSSSDYPESQPHDLAEDSSIVAATADAAPTITSTAADSSADGAITDVSSSSPANMQKAEEIISSSQNKLQLSAWIKQFFSNNEMGKAIMGLTTGAIIGFLALHQNNDIPLIHLTLMVTSLGLAFITLFTSLLLREFYPEYAAWAMLVGTISFLAFILVVLDFIFPPQLGFIGKLLVALFTILVIFFCCIRQCWHKGGDDD